MGSSAKRFADYFAVVGAGKTLEPLEKGTATTGSPRTCFDVAFRAEVVDRLPKEDYADAPLPPHVAMFCFPRGVQISRVRKPPLFFVFALTELDGTRFYGAVLQLHEPTEVHPPMPPSLADTTTVDPVYFPVSLCILSHFPFFSAFREYLRGLCRLLRGPPGPCPVERFIANFLYDVPVPVPGTSAVVCHIGAVAKRVTLPASTHFPLADFSLRYIFECLGVDGVVTLFFCLLHEHKVLFLSRQCTLLTLAAETLTALMYPFKWHHVYIPILGATLRDFLQAPTPFIMGIVTAPGDPPLPDFPDVVVVELDSGRIRNPFALTYPSEREKLASRLGNILTPHLTNLDLAFPPEDPINEVEKSDLIVATSQASVDTRIRVAFLLLFVPMFAHYRRSLRFLRKYPKPLTYFDKELFLASQKDADRPFLEVFMATQAFHIFKENAGLQRPNVFDLAVHRYSNCDDKSLEFILLRRNRHKREGVYEVPQPSLEGLPPMTFSYTSFPALSAELLPKRRHVRVLATKEALLDVPCYDKDEELVEASGQPDEERDGTPQEAEFVASCISDVVSKGTVSPKQEDAMLALLSQRYGGLLVSRKLAEYVNEQQDAKLSEVAFYSIGNLLRRVLSDVKDTFLIPWTLLRILPSIYHDVAGLPEFIYTTVCDMDVWKNPALWEFCLFRDVQEKRSSLPAHFRSTADDWESMDEEAQKKAAKSDERILFDVIGKIVFSMTMIGAPESQVRQTISRSVTLCGLDEQQLSSLTAFSASISKSNKASAAQLETLKGRGTARQSRNHASFGIEKRTSKQMLPKELRAMLLRLLQQGKQGDPLLAGSAGGSDGGSGGGSGPQEEDTISGALQEQSCSTVKRDDYTVTTMEGHAGAIECMTRHDSRLVAGTSMGRLALWDLDAKSCLGIVRAHADKVTAVKVCDGALFSSSNDGTVRLTDATDLRKELMSLKGHVGNVVCLDVNSNLVVSGGKDRTVRVWDKRDGKQVGEMTGHEGSVTCLRMGPRNATDGSPVVVSGSEDGTLRLWDIRMFSCALTMKGHSDWIKDVSFDTSTIVSASYDGSLMVWGNTDGKRLHTLAQHTGTVNAFHFSPSRHEVLSCSADCTAVRWDITTGTPASVFKGHSNSVSAISVLGDGDRVVTASFDQTIRLWTPTGRCIMQLRGHSDWISALLCFGDGTIVSGSWDSSIKLWQVGNDEPQSSDGSVSPGRLTRTGSASAIRSPRLFSNATSPTSPTSRRLADSPERSQESPKPPIQRTPRKLRLTVDLS